MNEELYKTLREYLENNPTSLAFARTAEILFEAGKIDAAITLLEKGLEQNPAYITARNLLGDFYYKKGDLEKAKQAYKKTLDIDPFNLNALWNLLKIAIDEQNFALAGAYLLQILTIDPTDKRAYNLLVQHWEQIERELPDLAKEPEEELPTIEVEDIGGTKFALIGTDPAIEVKPLPLVVRTAPEEIKALDQLAETPVMKPIELDEVEQDLSALMDIDEIFKAFEAPVKKATRQEPTKSPEPETLSNTQAEPASEAQSAVSSKEPPEETSLELEWTEGTPIDTSTPPETPSTEKSPPPTPDSDELELELDEDIFAPEEPSPTETGKTPPFAAEAPPVPDDEEMIDLGLDELTEEQPPEKIDSFPTTQPEEQAAAPEKIQPPEGDVFEIDTDEITERGTDIEDILKPESSNEPQTPPPNLELELDEDIFPFEGHEPIAEEGPLTEVSQSPEPKAGRDIDKTAESRETDSTPEETLEIPEDVFGFLSGEETPEATEVKSPSDTPEESPFSEKTSSETDQPESELENLNLEQILAELQAEVPTLPEKDSIPQEETEEILPVEQTPAVSAPEHEETPSFSIDEVLKEIETEKTEKPSSEQTETPPVPSEEQPETDELSLEEILKEIEEKGVFDFGEVLSETPEQPPPEQPSPEQKESSEPELSLEEVLKEIQEKGIIEITDEDQETKSPEVPDGTAQPTADSTESLSLEEALKELQESGIPGFDVSTDTQPSQTQEEQSQTPTPESTPEEELSLEEILKEIEEKGVFDFGTVEESAEEVISESREAAGNVPEEVEIEPIEGLQTRQDTGLTPPEELEELPGLKKRDEFVPLEGEDEVIEIEGLEKRTDNPFEEIPTDLIEPLIKEPEEQKTAPPPKPKKPKDLATVTTAEIYAAQGLTEKAIEIYEKVLSNPDLPAEDRERYLRRLEILRERLKQEKS